jgi:hypothetical protein
VTRRRLLPNLSPPFKPASSLGLSIVKFSFCYLIVALSASCVMLFFGLPWSHLPLPCQSFLSKVLHSFHIYIYVKIPPSPTTYTNPRGLAVTHHNDTYTTMPSHLPYCTSHRIALQLAISFIHHRHNHHRHHGTVTSIHPYDNPYSYSCGTADCLFFNYFSWPCCESSSSSHALNLGVFTKRILS